MHYQLVWSTPFTVPNWYSSSKLDIYTFKPTGHWSMVFLVTGHLYRQWTSTSSNPLVTGLLHRHWSSTCHWSTPRSFAPEKHSQEGALN